MVTSLLVTVPSDGSRLIDRSGWLSEPQRAQLEAAQDQLSGSHQVDVFVALLDRLPRPSESVQTFAGTLRRQWRSARQGDGANDVLIVVTRNERSIRLDFGEAWGPGIDHLAQHTIDSRMQPRFRDGDFFAGIAAAIEHVGYMAEIGVGTDYSALAEPPRARVSRFVLLIDAVPVALFCMAVIAFFALRWGVQPRRVGSVVAGLTGALGTAFFAVTGDGLSAALVGAVAGLTAVAMLCSAPQTRPQDGHRV
jgi:uncharacterized protein